MESLLLPGGVFVLIDGFWQELRPAIASLVPQFDDVTGGWLGGDRGYEGAKATVLVKGAPANPELRTPGPENRAWSCFRPYANTPGVALEETTQVYHRAKCRGGVMPWLSDGKEP